MNVHGRARTTSASRALLIRRVRLEAWCAAAAASAMGISRRTAHKWLKRFRMHGDAGRLIYALASTLSLVPSLPLQQACLRSVARSLAPDGLFVSEPFTSPSHYSVSQTAEVPIITPSGTSLCRVTLLSTPPGRP